MSKAKVFRLLLLLIILSVILTGCGVRKDAQGNLQIPGWIEPLAAPLRFGVTFLHDYILTPVGLPSYGLAIILLTIVLRALLYPLTKKQMDSMRKMQELQPQLKELQEKYGKDREKFAQKQMELYKQAGVNPAMGCLPMLLQMPILFAFYYALISLGPLLKEPFLWIPDLSFPKYTEGLGWLSPVTPQHLLSADVLPYLILPVIYVITQFVIQRMSQAANVSAQGSSANSAMMLMPLMFAYITLIVPSGLTLYWITSNIIQIVQQGLTTGWSGLLPSREKPDGPTGSVTGGLRRVLGGAGMAEQSANSPASVGEEAPPAMSAGRRRKLRKKKKKR